MLEKFFEDSRTLDLMRSETVFEILSLKEENSSNLLAWLLDPKESHGQGNKFAMHLLKACAENGKVYAYTAGERNRNLDVGNKEYFKNAVVWTEYPVTDYLGGRNGKINGRIDILLVDVENDLAMVIENKYGSQEHDDQCRTYKKALMQLCKNRPEMKFVFVYLDLYGNEASQKEFYNLSYDEVLSFKPKLDKRTMAWRLLESLEKDVNGIEENDRLLKELCEDYGEELERYVSKGLYRSSKKGVLDDYFKTGDNEVLRYAEYEGVIDDILNFKKHQSKVFDVRYDEKFSDFLKKNNLDFSATDYTDYGVLTFSRECFCNEADKMRWAVYGQIAKEKKGYSLKLIYGCKEDDTAMQKKLKKFLNGQLSHTETYIVTSNIAELFKVAGKLVKDLNEAEKLFQG